MQLQLRLVLHEGHHEGRLGQGCFHGDQHHEGRPFDQVLLEGQVQILEPLPTIGWISGVIITGLAELMTTTGTRLSAGV